MESDSTPATPTGAIKPLPEKRRNRWVSVPIFVLGIVAGVGLAVAWPKLAPKLTPLATCLQNLAQGHVPIRITGTPEENAEWVRVYGEMRPVSKFDGMFGPTYNQLLDFYMKFRRPPIGWSDIDLNGKSAQEADAAYQARLQEWQQRVCKFEGLCVVQTDKSGAAAAPPYSDIPPGYHVVPSTPATTTR